MSDQFTMPNNAFATPAPSADAFATGAQAFSQPTFATTAPSTGTQTFATPGVTGPVPVQFEAPAMTQSIPTGMVPAGEAAIAAQLAASFSGSATSAPDEDSTDSKLLASGQKPVMRQLDRSPDFALVEHAMKRNRMRIANSQRELCVKYGKMKPDGTPDFAGYLDSSPGKLINIYTDYPNQNIINETSHLKKDPKGGLWYYDFHPATVKGEFSKKESTKIINDKPQNITLCKISWKYNLFFNGMSSLRDIDLIFPPVIVYGLDYKTKPYTVPATKDKPARDILLENWDMTLELLSSNPEHMFLRECLKEIELCMANTYAKYVGEMQPGKEKFNVNDPAEDGMRELTWFRGAANKERAKRNVSTAFIKAKLNKPRFGGMQELTSRFLLPAKLVPYFKKIAPDGIVPWEYLLNKVFICNPIVRIVQISNGGKKGSVGFDLVTALLWDIKDQPGMEEAKQLMDEIIGMDDSFLNNFIASAKELENDINAFVPGQAAPSKSKVDPAASNPNANVVSDASKLDATVAALMGQTQPGFSNQSAPPPAQVQSAPVPQAQPVPIPAQFQNQSAPAAGPAGLPPPSSFPVAGGPGTQGFSSQGMPNQAFNNGMSPQQMQQMYQMYQMQQGGAPAAPPQGMLPPQGTPMMQNNYGGLPQQTMFSPTYAPS